MYSSINTKLIGLIRGSEVLASKLSPAQLEKFLEASMSLPTEKQDELMHQLTQEKEKMNTIRKHALEAYEKEVTQIVKTEKKKVEASSRKNEQEEAEKLLEGI